MFPFVLIFYCSLFSTFYTNYFQLLLLQHFFFYFLFSSFYCIIVAIVVALRYTMFSFHFTLKHFFRFSFHIFFFFLFVIHFSYSMRLNSVQRSLKFAWLSNKHYFLFTAIDSVTNGWWCDKNGVNFFFALLFSIFFFPAIQCKVFIVVLPITLTYKCHKIYRLVTVLALSLLFFFQRPPSLAPMLLLLHPPSPSLGIWLFTNLIDNINQIVWKMILFRKRICRKVSVLFLVGIYLIAIISSNETE